MHSDRLAHSAFVKFLGVPEFLEVILENHPQLFDEVCVLAVNQMQCDENRRSFYQHLLTNAGWEALQSYESFVKLFEMLIVPFQETSAAWLYRTGPLLHSASFKLLDSLSEQGLRSLYDFWQEQLRSTNPVHVSRALHIASAFQVLHISCLVRSSFSSPLPTKSTLRQWIVKCSALYESEKCSRIVNTTVLTVLKLLTQDNDLGEASLLPNLRIASEILKSTPAHILSFWSKSNPFAVKKLAQKIASLAGMPWAQLAACDVLIQLDTQCEAME
jgi:hypothetical protein